MGIRQLAHELQLSIGTVSRALNDRPDVNDDTRARVKAAAVRAGYVPNQSGRSLRSGRTGIVAAVIPTRTFASTTDSGLFVILEGARRTLRGHALELIVLFRGPDEDALENLQRTVQRRIADAVIISQTTANDPRLTYLKACGIDYVAFGRSSGIDDYPFVDFDFESMAREAVRLFVAGGHRRLAVALSDPALNYETTTAAAFRAEAARQGLGRRGRGAADPRRAADAGGLARFAVGRRRRRRSWRRTSASRRRSMPTWAGWGSTSAGTCRWSAPSRRSTRARCGRPSRTSAPISTRWASRWRRR